MSQIATNGQPPRNHSRACNRYKLSSQSITESWKEVALSKKAADSISSGGHTALAEKSKDIPRMVVALFVIYFAVFAQTAAILRRGRIASIESISIRSRAAITQRSSN